ncbi:MULTISPECIES: putative entry exclusion protein TrbK-alt [Bradyrhizobium]|uniref:putative entry exclusion protein TrbK-alt n=1 Tax=Bradyrhizobium centrosematis TaxID=1300039 RepID=UPI00216987A1|nr:putative entry exclusion protein TrbK-alt [Bradyrhizobium centrosematis]MCS3765604.1 conjugative transfer region protein TrbK [Bradyrhizobium centrosematis]MCS3778138.1 conjugative transfer region protein TrbK [Bradyrhizobium centrosematis]
MMKSRFERLPMAVALGLTVLVVAACAIRLRGDESATQSSASHAAKPDPTAAKLEQCRTVIYEQREALLECQRIWAERRSQFLGKSGSVNGLSVVGTAPSSSPVPRKDESRLPSLSPSIPSQSE